ncbi:MAG TPA: hypothetical protein VD997_05575 [Phycisphaerales bacterium]|nr:hypothetical protein [Phycisphaerales bacterium]
MGSTLLMVLGVLAAVTVGAVVFVMLLIPFFKGVGWVLSRLFTFITSEIGDVFRFVGAVLLAVLYVPAVVGSVLIGKWSAARHFGRAFQGELGQAGACVYRLIVGNPVRLFGLGGLTEGIERRLPEVVRAVPGTEGTAAGGGAAAPRTGQFDGYRIVGTLAGGGSGAKLYIATPEPEKRAAFVREGLHDVAQVVIKSFSLSDGSSLPQIVRESRSLDAAKRMGLILDHELSQHRFYYVMRYVPGESLSMVTRRLHAASPPEGLAEPQLRLAIGYACDLMETLSEYHRGGLWHKDVKPDNIIVDAGPNPRAHLVDFGLVSSLRSAMTLTTHGTEYFRDPELVRQALKGVKVHEVDGTRFDIYAAGAVVYSMLEDSFPAHGVLSAVSKRCPDAVKWIIRRAMTDYDKRYTSAEMMLADLRAVVRAADPFEVKPVDLPSMSGSPTPVATPAAAVVAGVGAVAAAGMAAAGVAPAAAAAPIAGAAAVGAPLGAAAMAGAAGLAGAAAEVVRRAPRLRMVNWWSGRAEVDPAAAPRAHEPVYGQPPSDVAVRAGEIAEKSVREARRVVGSAWAGVQAGLGRARHAPENPGRPWVPPAGPRKPAREQLASARARMEAARQRAHTRTGAAGELRSSGMKGVLGAVAVFLVGVAFVISMANRGGGSAQVEQPAPTGVFVNGVEVERDEFIPAEKLSVPMGLRVLMINDIRRPWTPEVSESIEDLVASMLHTGVTPMGEVPNPEERSGEVDAAAKARLVLDSEQVPVDSSQAPERFRDWFASEGSGVDAVLWIAPAVEGAGGHPRAFVFTPHSGDNLRTRAIVSSLEPIAPRPPDDERR